MSSAVGKAVAAGVVLLLAAAVPLLSAYQIELLTQMLIYDKIIMPRGKLWKRYEPLQVYAPPKEFVFALKILAGRDQDLADCRILLPQTHIRTRKPGPKGVRSLYSA